ncbi:MAG: response regulator [bacterium]|nr:response regulator [bacterium]
MHNTSFLVVDDCATIRLVISSIIRNNLGSKNIYVAADGENACEIMENHTVDFIISDWDMPIMGGDKLLSFVRNDLNLKDLPFMMLSTDKDSISTEKVLKLGANQHLIKPVSPDDLEAKIRLSWNGTNKRMDKRFAFLPQYDSMLQVGEKSVPVDIINISRTGALIRTIYSNNLNLFADYDFKLTVDLPDRHKIISIDPIVTSFVRIEREVCKHSTLGVECYLGPVSGGCNPELCKLCNVALRFDLGAMKRDVLTQLNDFIEWLASRGPGIVAEN